MPMALHQRPPTFAILPSFLQKLPTPNPPFPPTNAVLP